MDIILLERVEKLGQIGDVVSVKPGYARNFLLPTKKALRATKANISLFESQRTQIEAVNLERRNEAESVAAKLEGFSVVVIRQAGDSGQLYGSVTGRDIADAVIEKGVTIDRGQVRLEDPSRPWGCTMFGFNCIRRSRLPLPRTWRVQMMRPSARLKPAGW